MNMLTVTESPEPRNPRALDAASNVIPFPNVPEIRNFLTAPILLQHFRRGELDEAVFLALMASAELRP